MWLNTRQLKPTIQIDYNLSLIKDSSQYTCSILIGKNYLTYALSDAEYTMIYLLKHYYFDDKVIGKNDFREILADPVFKEVNNVKIAIDTLKSTLIPAEYFDKNAAETYFTFMHELTDEESLHTNHVNPDKVSLFSLKKSTVSFLGNIYKNTSFFDASACLLNTYPALLKIENQFTCFLWIKDDCVTISLYAQRMLQFHQIYTDEQNMDIMYHVANYIHRHQIDKEKITLYLHGESKRMADVNEVFESYFPKVKYCSRVLNLKYPDSLMAQPSHYFFTLFSLVACES